jgi:energy-coupling factor transport system ATP-binding protein
MLPMNGAPLNPAPRIQTDAICFHYPQKGLGLDPTTLAIQAGQFVLISGPSGCGKSTLARCLTGIIPHLYHGQLSGSAWVNGLRTSDTLLWQLAEHAGMVFQNPAAQMLSSSVEGEIVFGLENLGLPPKEIRQRLESTLLRFGLEALRDRSPSTLSGGEQQKLALAAIMARQPSALVLDEPFSMLDATAVAELVTHLSDLVHSGTTVIACEHRPEYLQSVADLLTIPLTGSSPARESTSSDESVLPVTPLPRPWPQLEARGLDVQLGARPVLRNLHLSASGGQVIAVVGRNGVGKTTLLRVLAGLQKHPGSVAIDGGRPDLGLVFQNADLQLFNASVREEILYRVLDPDMALYAYLLQTLGLARYEHTPPLLLSEGEKKRVALATVLMRQPRHGVLLDEPSLGQDIAHKAVLMRLAHSLARAGQLVILTTHDWTLAIQADRLLLMGAEGWVADGPPSEILRNAPAWTQLGLAPPSWLHLPQTERSQP